MCTTSDKITRIAIPIEHLKPELEEFIYCVDNDGLSDFDDDFDDDTLTSIAPLPSELEPSPVEP